MDSIIPLTDKTDIILENYLLYDINASELADASIIDIKHCSTKNSYPFENIENHYCFIVNFDGSMLINNLDKTIKIDKPSIYLKFPKETPTIKFLGESSEYIVLAFNGNCASKLCARCHLTKENRIFEVLNEDIKTSLNNLINSNKLILAKDINQLAAFYTLFSTMIEYIGQLYQHSEKQLYILKILQYIKENYHKHDLSLKHVSSFVDLHFNYISQIFKSVTGISFSRYINIYRIQKACELMENGEYFIKNIALKVGFDDPLHFSKVFKSIKGVSPKDFRVSAV